jgi:hypothetical protein
MSDELSPGLQDHPDVDFVPASGKTYLATWKVEVEAEDIEEARRKHMEALHATEDAPVAIYVQGDGPAEVNTRNWPTT